MFFNVLFFILISQFCFINSEIPVPKERNGLLSNETSAMQSSIGSPLNRFSGGREGEIIPTLSYLENDDEITSHSITEESETTTPSEKPEQSVFPRKGVPELVPSVHARKGVDFDQKIFPDNSKTSDMVTFPSTTFSSVDLPAAEIKPLISTTTSRQFAQKSSYPQSPYEVTEELNFEKVDENYLKVETKLKENTNVHHTKKPSASVDMVSNEASTNVPLMVGISLCLVIIVIASLVAYKKLKDVWSRRHYNRMDFLIDGMYDL